MANGNWDAIRNYAKASWNPLAAAMDQIGIASLGAQTGADGGFAAHNLSQVVTDTEGNTWTATSVCTGSTPPIVTLTAGNGLPAYVLIDDDEPGSAGPTDPNL